eukprot:CAMPEP_0175093344 /NCGR_PEP_ID=MMETSP0086_2-20121207/2960_1 /TAXON_ID=136419 /ORGANISM="Unknown Unknown, Strain D1" /LENGTH=203 /DNA_ID=CAMNT_0016366295 /DNA_START=22 /DNA_END=633 /DNA_ORIENTATION=+
MSGTKGNKMLQYVNWRMRIQITETRTLLGTFMAYDKHMNLVLGDCEEYRKVRGKKASEEREEKRLLGLVLLRGENVISMSAESPPPPQSRAQAVAGPGQGKPAGRGMAIAPLAAAPKGLSGPVKGIGGPAADMMRPQVRPVLGGAPVTYAGRGQMARPPPPPAGMGAPPGGFPPPPMGMPFMMGRGGPPPGMPPGQMFRPPPQ